MQTPAWINADLIVDVTDAWAEVRDPDNEVGAVVLAYLRIVRYEETTPLDPAQPGEYVPVYEVAGLRAEPFPNVFLYHDRAWCIAQGLAPLLHQIERNANT
jgi:hypothetical protein